MSRTGPVKGMAAAIKQSGTGMETSSTASTTTNSNYFGNVLTALTPNYFVRQNVLKYITNVEAIDDF
jgi:hypothetical protein